MKTNGFIFTLLLTLTLSATFSSQAEANSRFTVKNDGSKKVLITIFNGDDSICISEAKDHTVDPGGEKSMGCAGGGNHQCKAMINVKKDGEKSWTQVCLNSNTACHDTTMKLPNHSTLTVTDYGTDETRCKVE